MSADLRSLTQSGKLPIGAELYHRGRKDRREITAKVIEDGVEVGGVRYRSLSTAASRLAGHPTNGWLFWRLRETGQPIARLRR